MRPTLPLSAVLSALCVLTAACGKRDAVPAAAESSSPAASAPAESPATAVPAGPDSAARSEKQRLLDYATMEDEFLNDASGQWASSVRVSSTFGEKPGEPFDSTNSNSPWNARGKPDQRSWTNNNQSIGNDWFEATFATPVAASAVRVVFPDGATAASKLELIDAGGTSHTVWSGVNNDAPESRGPRTWFVRTFPATPYQVRAVKVTIANALASGYKEIDAIQLIGK